MIADLNDAAAQSMTKSMLQIEKVAADTYLSLILWGQALLLHVLGTTTPTAPSFPTPMMYVHKHCIGGAPTIFYGLDIHPVTFTWLSQKMIGSKDNMRNNARPLYTYHDHIFENEINHAIRLTDEHYENMLFREALKTGFYDLQISRDRYRDITATGDGMNWQLVQQFIEVKFMGAG